MTFCGGVSTSITTSQTAVVTVSLPAATAVPSNVQIIADLQSVYSTKTNICELHLVVRAGNPVLAGKPHL